MSLIEIKLYVDLVSSFHKKYMKLFLDASRVCLSFGRIYPRIAVIPYLDITHLYGCL